MIHSVGIQLELLEFVVLLSALLVELFKRTVALSILLTRGISCSSCFLIEVCMTNLLTPPNNCNSSGKVFVTSLLTSLENHIFS